MHRCSFCGLPFAGAPIVETPPRASEQRVDAETATDRGYCCYGCLLTEKVLGPSARPEDADDGGSTKLLVRFGIGAFFAMNVMTFSIAVSSQYGWNEVHSAGNVIGVMDWAQLLLTIPVLVFQGLPVFRDAAADLLGRRLSLNLLFAIGILASLIASAMSFIRGAGPVYLETACMLLTLYTFGRWIDARSKNRTARTLSRLLESPGTLYERIHPDPGPTAPPLLRVGDLVRIAPGDMLPVDGVVHEGGTFVDESSLTGESRPVPKHPGDPVHAGTLNHDGAPVVRVTAVGDDRRLARIERLIEEALRRPTRAMRLADRITARLIPAVIAAALLTFGVWFWLTDIHSALLNALAVLLISCPCSLGLATPLVVWVALDRAARHGILVRSGDVLEDLTQVRAFVFDKTGTLSDPVAREVDIHSVPPDPTGEDDLLRICASLESATRHPIAESLVALARDRSLALLPVEEPVTVPGAGIRGRVLIDGTPRDVALGNEHLMESLAIDITGAAGHAALPGSVVYAAIDGRPAAVILLREHYRDALAEMAQELTRRGRHVVILTGDRMPAAAALGERLGVEVHAGMTPEAKACFIHELRDAHGMLAMFGDGVNDAAAIAAADVGMAMSAGARLSNEVAEVSFFNPDLRGIGRLLAIAGMAQRKIRQNLIWSFAYNGIGIALAMAGVLHPIVSSVAMIGSSIIVTWNATRRDETSFDTGGRAS